MSVNINNFTMITAKIYFSASLSMYRNQVMIVFPNSLMQMPRLLTPHLKEAIICLFQYYLQNKRKSQGISFSLLLKDICITTFFSKDSI